MCGDDLENVPLCFHSVVIRKPNCVALRSAEERLSYADLDSAANSLRDQLAAAGAGKGSLVGILLDRSISSIIAFLAVLKAGGAFVPLDPVSPPQSLLDIIRRPKLACVVSNGATLGRLPQLAAEAAALIDVDATPLSKPAGHPVLAPTVANALVLCCDEKSQCQALERSQPGLPLGPRHPRTMTHGLYPRKNQPRPRGSGQSRGCMSYWSLRAGSVCLNSRLAAAKWISAMVMLQPRLAAAQ